MLLRFCLASVLRTTLSCFEAGELLQIENANAATLVGGQAFAMQQEGLPVAACGETLASNVRTTVLKRYQILRRVCPSGGSRTDRHRWSFDSAERHADVDWDRGRERRRSAITWSVSDRRGTIARRVYPREQAPLAI